MLAAVEVEATGAVAEPTPPDIVVYQSRLLPVAVKPKVGAFWQAVTGLVTMGAAMGDILLIAALAGDDTQPVVTSFTVIA